MAHPLYSTPLYVNVLEHLSADFQLHSDSSCLRQTDSVGLRRQYSSTDIPMVHAKHFALCALQHPLEEQPTVFGFCWQYSCTDKPREHAKHLAVIAEQHIVDWQPVVSGLRRQNSCSDIPMLQAKHSGVFALQHGVGLNVAVVRKKGGDTWATDPQHCPEQGHDSLHVSYAYCPACCNSDGAVI
mmetsp:Transcript_44614/g.82125  ORF Transcript_44614/g.82125 Transcript_44614/m.82125 type:complete len:184 (+) Transcript_44614:175-726(+)